MKKAKFNVKKIIALDKVAKISKEPMSLAMAYLPYDTVLQMNIYYAVLNKIAINDLKDKDLFSATVKAVIPVSEIGESKFERINAALKGLLNARLSLINERLEFCRHLVPIIGTEYSRHTGKIVISLHPDLFGEYINMIHRGYTSYQFWQMLRLKKFFSKRLYEILSGRWLLNDGEWSISFTVLKRLLSAERYDNYIFVQRALNGAAEEFEKKDIDLRFTYTLVRGVKNQIDRVVFSIQKLKADGEADEGSLSLAQAKALTQTFSQLSSSDKNLLVLSLLQQYTFKHTQVEAILASPAKAMLFYSTHTKIHTGQLKNIQNKTRYMAATLGFKNY
jgi:plasmid replication initiation protein